MADLTDLNTFKRYAGIGVAVTKHDSLLCALITAATARIERIAGRIFGSADYREWHDGPGSSIGVSSSSIMIARNHPLIRVNRVMTGEAAALDLQYTGSDILANVAVYADAVQATTGIRLHTISASGTATNTERTFSDSPTLSTMATQLNTTTDWTVTAQGDDWPTLDLHPLTGLDAKTGIVGLTRPDTICRYRQDYTAGTVELLGLVDQTIHMATNPTDRPLRRHRYIMLDYRGGYDAIPADIEQMANEFINVMFAGRRNTGHVKSENIGEYSYTLADATQITETQMAILRTYMELR